MQIAGSPHKVVCVAVAGESAVHMHNLIRRDGQLVQLSHTFHLAGEAAAHMHNLIRRDGQLVQLSHTFHLLKPLPLQQPSSDVTYVRAAQAACLSQVITCQKAQATATAAAEVEALQQM